MTVLKLISKKLRKPKVENPTDCLHLSLLTIICLASSDGVVSEENFDLLRNFTSFLYIQHTILW